MFKLTKEEIASINRHNFEYKLLEISKKLRQAKPRRHLTPKPKSSSKRVPLVNRVSDIIRKK